jgi:hypothetical protein
MSEGIEKRKQDVYIDKLGEDGEGKPTYAGEPIGGGLTTEQEQEIAKIADKADKSNVLELDNTDEFTPTADYHPATKKYVDDVSGGGAGTFNPVQDIAELKALDTTDTIVFKDKWAIIVEDEGAWFRFDRESAAAESLPWIVAPTVGTGRWIQDQKVQLDAKADKKAIALVLNFLDETETYEFVQAHDYKITSKTEETGVTASIKLHGTATNYVLGNTILAGGRLDIMVNVPGYVRIEGELI